MKEYLPVKNILVAIDVCEDISITSPIMEQVLELASAFSSKVWIIHVVPDMRRPVPFNVDSEVLRREAATELCNEHDYLQRLAQCLRDRDVDATALLVEGPTISNDTERI